MIQRICASKLMLLIALSFWLPVRTVAKEPSIPARTAKVVKQSLVRVETQIYRISRPKNLFKRFWATAVCDQSVDQLGQGFVLHLPNRIRPKYDYVVVNYHSIIPSLGSSDRKQLGWKPDEPLAVGQIRVNGAVARVVKVLPQSDLALLEVRRLPWVKRLPLLITRSTWGTVYHLTRRHTRVEVMSAEFREKWQTFHNRELLYVDLDTQDGDSGSLLVDEFGLLFGIVSAHYSNGAFGYTLVVPARDVEELVRGL